MSNTFETVRTPTNPKAPWVKPVVRQMRAGSAEINTGTVDDADAGADLNES